MAIIILCTYLACYFVSIGRGFGLRESMLLAATALGAFVLGITQVLSLFQALSVWPVFLSWCAFLVAVVLLFRKSLKPGLNHFFEGCQRFFSSLDRMGWIFVGVSIFFASGTFIAAIMYPVLNFDSLTYHLPRVFFWIQNKSIAFYPTTEVRQLLSAPYTEYAITHIKILSGNTDHLVNLVQWTSYVLAAAAVSLIVQWGGVSKKWQELSFLLTLVIPMAILQASSTQTDMTCAMWCATAVLFGLRLIEVKAGKQYIYAMLFGVAATLATQAKTSAFITLAPFAVWFLIRLFKREHFFRFAKIALVACLALTLLSGGWYIRNAVILDGDFLGSSVPPMDSVLISDASPKNLVANTLRNILADMATPVQRVNEEIVDSASSVFSAIGVDLDTDTNKISPGLPFSLSTYVTNHDYGGSPLTVVLTVLAVVILGVSLFRRRGEGSSFLVRKRSYLIAAVTSAALLLALIAWQPWVNRLTLSSSILLVPIIIFASQEFTMATRRVGHGLLALAYVSLVLWAVAALCLSSTNRLVPYGESTFWNNSWSAIERRIMLSSTDPVVDEVQTALESIDAKRVGIRSPDTNLALYSILNANKDKTFLYVGDGLFPEGESVSEDVDAVIFWQYGEEDNSPPRESGVIYEKFVEGLDCWIVVYVPNTATSR